MRLLITVVLVTLIFVQTNAQNNVLATGVDIQVRGKTLKQVISEINQKYQINFSYSDNILPKGIILQSSSTYSNLVLLLDHVFIPKGIGYELVDDQIVLFLLEPKVKWYYLNGFLMDSITSESIINGSVYIKGLSCGVVTNAYGFFSIKIPAGKYLINFASLGFKSIDSIIPLRRDTLIIMRLPPKVYQVNEVVVNPHDDEFIESSLNNINKIDIATLKELPGVFGENDALRNLELLPGLQNSEISTSNISVRGGSSDQTVFLMDESNVYNASHFGGFSSVFNPDVVNNVGIYKGDIPISQGGALSSIIDVRLRDGNMQNWKTTGSIGLLTARALVEGPIVKNRSSVLIAFRRTYTDKLLELLSGGGLDNFKFYFYDGNFKLNYRLNPKNRLYLSGYTGTDMFKSSVYLKRSNTLATIRWNHIFGSHLFCNVSAIGSYSGMMMSNFYYNGNFEWRSKCWDGRFKADFSHYVNDQIKLNYGFSSVIYNLEPFALVPLKDKLVYISIRTPDQPIVNHSVYLNQDFYPYNDLLVQIGARVTYYSGSTDYQNKGDSSMIYTEPNLTLSYQLNNNSLIKAVYSYHVQPIHQLQVSSYGIAVSRWMPSNKRFLPEESSNYSLGYFSRINDHLDVSSELYYRKMNNLIETMQEMRLIYEPDPERFIYHSSAKVTGCEFGANIKYSKLKAFLSYSYTNLRWKTLGINNNKSYPASFNREHSVNLSGLYRFTKRLTFSASWQYASGMPYTAASRIYFIDGKKVLDFDKNKINTKKLPPYHRLDLSVELAGKKNEKRKWKSYWNFSAYNAYFRKNPLGVVYFNNNPETNETELSPGYYYFYQFVPSITYRFQF